MPQLPAAGAASQLTERVTSFARQEPLAVAVGIGAAAVILILVVLLVRRFRRSVGARFQRVLSQPTAVSILMHPNPDPDAMATALGVAHIAERAGTPVAIEYPGQIRHQENRAFRAVLDLHFESIENADEITSETVILVDHNEPRGFRGADKVTPYAIVDHHPGNGTGTTFTDVRTDYGACASIIAEYFEEMGIEPVALDDGETTDGGVPGIVGSNGDGSRLPSSIATGLLYGILSDTNHLTRGCSRAEFEASAYLYPGVDEDALDRIANPQVDAEVLDIKARAITERDVRNPYAVSNVGSLSNADAIPQAADELLNLEGVSAVVVYGERNGTLHLSGRSRDDRVHMGDTLQAAVEGIATASAGGHARMGGGQLAVEELAEVTPSSTTLHDELKERLFKAMAGDV